MRTLARMVAPWCLAASLFAPAALFAGIASFPATASAAEAAGEGEHAGEHAEHIPHFSDINFAEGLLGVSEDAEPGLLWRRPGTPVPLLALIINSAILFYLLYRFAGPAVKNGLKKRKADIMTGIDQAAKMKADAEEQLARYEAKLDSIDREIERVKQQMREAAEAERERVLDEARERRERMERDARLLVEQELKAAQQLLFQQAVRAAIASAQEAITQRITPTDQQKLLEGYLDSVKRAGTSLGGKP